jgi:signal transduction histidine kinase
MTSENSRILVVDDEEVIRDICLRSLGKLGYNIALAENGVKALEQLRKTPYDVVFTDFRMPLMNGMELLEAIKRDFAYVEVVMMTAYATIESAIQAMKVGATDFILKPIKPDQIRLVAQKCIERIQLSQENNALRLANKKLTEVQEMKNKFIAITSHELRTPVSHLKGYLGILHDSYYYQLSEEEKEQCLQVIQNAVKDLEEIVTNMHNLSGLEHHVAAMRKERLDLNKLVAMNAKAYDLFTRKRRLTVEISFGADTVTALGDPGQIKGVLGEVIQNAIKFTPDGGGIHLSTRVEAEYSVVSIRDTGIGIATEELGKIFEKFYEVQSTNHHTTSQNAFMGGGLGLGLSSVRAILEAHGGGIKVKSKLGQGSEFLIFLPKWDEAGGREAQ